jgi:hypothetical protein
MKAFSGYFGDFCMEQIDYRGVVSKIWIWHEISICSIQKSPKYPGISLQVTVSDRMNTIGTRKVLMT